MARIDEIGALCIAGDWACVHGDLPALAEIVAKLAAFVDEPLRGALLALVEMCRHHDLHGAVAQWPMARERMFDEGARPPP